MGANLSEYDSKIPLSLTYREGVTLEYCKILNIAEIKISLPDYPPFFAYFEYILSIPAAKVDPLLVQISKTPISTENVVLFQKITVIITDIAVLFGAASISKVKGSEN